MAGKFNDMNSGGGSSRDQSTSFIDLASKQTEYNAIMKMEDDFNRIRAAKRKKLGVEEMQEELKTLKKGSPEEIKLRKDIAAIEEQINRESIEATTVLRKNKYAEASAAQKAIMMREEAANIAERRKSLEQQKNDELAMAEGNEAEKARIRQKYAEQDKELAEQEKDATSMAQGLEKSADKQRSLNDDRSRVDRAKDKSKQATEDTKAAVNEYEKKKAELENLKESGASEEEIEAAKEQLKSAEMNVKTARKNEATAKIQEAAAKAMEDIGKAFYSEFNDFVRWETENQGIIMSRLQGSNKDYEKVMEEISSQLAISPFVQAKKVVEEMKKAADMGIVYNLEQRAFLSEISDKIAATFDAFDSNLTRLIRLQQADMTQARLGMEAYMTKFLNSMFEDNSYMKDGYDNVMGAILEASSTMSRDMAAAFEFTVQKWMGSLYSLGISQEAITEITKGLTYIATGDVNSLSSNTNLQTLFAMAASQAGLSYSDLLIEGLDSSKTNKLLGSMVTYLADIAENSDNQVVRAAYGDIFNFQMSDLKAFSNLKQDIASVSEVTMQYSDMTNELVNQLSNVSSRVSMQGMMENIYQNAMYGIAEDLSGNPVTFGMIRMLEFMKNADLDMNIPFVNAAGFGLDLNTSVQDLLNLGVGLTSALSLAGNILKGLGSKGGTNLNSWNYSEYTSRGGSMSFTTDASSSDTTGSAYVTNYNEEDMTNSTLNTATDDAEETKEITNKNSDPGYTVNDIYESVIKGTEGDSWARVQEKVLGQVINATEDYLHTRDTRMFFIGQSLDVQDSQLSFDNSDLEVYDKRNTESFKQVLGSAKVVDNENQVKVSNKYYKEIYDKVSLIHSLSNNAATSDEPQEVVISYGSNGTSSSSAFVDALAKAISNSIVGDTGSSGAKTISELYTLIDSFKSASHQTVLTDISQTTLSLLEGLN